MREISSSNAVNDSSVDSLVEGSLEYREMKRLYTNEKRQCEKWRKHYQILKGQLMDLRKTAIRKLIFLIIELTVQTSRATSGRND